MPSARMLDNDEKARQLIARLIGKVCLFKNKKGSGKSTAIVAIAHMAREYYGINVCVVGASLGLNREAFGPFSFLSVPKFLESLALFQELAEAENDAGAMAAMNWEQVRVRKILEDLGLIDSIILFDEFYQQVDASRRTLVSLLLGYFFSAIRHYGDTALIVAPRKGMLDNRVREQIDYTVNCTNRCQTWKSPAGLKCIAPDCRHIFSTTFASELEMPFRFKIYAPPFQRMFNTHSAIGYSVKLIDKAKVRA